MAEDEQAKPTSEPPPAAAAEAAPPEEEPAQSAAPSPEPVAPPAPAAPPNKVHEWGAALGIMVFLALVLWVFLNFLRSASM